MDIINPDIIKVILDFLSKPLSDKVPQFTVGIFLLVVFVIIYLGQRSSNR